MDNKPYKAKKSLGQNFLKSEKALNLMVSAGNIENVDTVIEIGPGKGVLTEKLLEKAKKVIAIEKDKDLIEILKEKFEKDIKEGKLELIEGDCLEFDISPFLRGSAPSNRGVRGSEKINHSALQTPLLNKEEKKYKIIANIPYYITGAIIRKFLESKNQPETMVLLIQKEVAERIVTRDTKESLLSLSVKAYGTPKYIDKVSKRYFSPSPKVDSAIIAINNISRANFKSNLLESKFFEVIHAGFGHKRKVLIKNLADKGYNREKIVEQFKELNINEKARSEDISIEKWLILSKNL